MSFFESWLALKQTKKSINWKFLKLFLRLFALLSLIMTCYVPVLTNWFGWLIFIFICKKRMVALLFWKNPHPLKLSRYREKNRERKRAFGVYLKQKLGTPRVPPYQCNAVSWFNKLRIRAYAYDLTHSVDSPYKFLDVSSFEAYNHLYWFCIVNYESESICF